MIRNKKLLLALSGVFVLLECCLAILIQTEAAISFNARYCAVLLAALFITLFFERSLSFLFTASALLFTVFADYFLVYLDEMKQLPAMYCFAVVHIAYFLRLYFEEPNKAHRKHRLILQATLSLLILVVTKLVLKENCDALALVSMFCYANLILNTVTAFHTLKKSYLVALGLLLFIFCDTLVGLSVIKAYLPVSPDSFIYTLLYPGFDIVWAFYLPSQALLAMSLLPRALRRGA